MNKEQLELKVKSLNASIEQFENESAALRQELHEAQKELEDINKPQVTEEVMDDIYDIVLDAVQLFDFNDPSLYDCEFTINYDNRIELDNIEFQCIDDLTQAIYNRIGNLFKILKNEKQQITEVV